jgi:hypothetical protein
MAVLKYYDGSDWEPVVSALQGPTGPTGPTGATGPTGSDASSGLVLINTTSFSAVASQSINDVFSATYDNYLLVAYIGGPETERDLNFRWRVSAADNTTSNYQWQLRNNSSTTSDGLRSTSQTSGRIGKLAGSVASTFTMEIFRPFTAFRTGALVKGLNKLSTSILLTDVGVSFDATTSFTGITFFPTADTITGTVSIYGYSQ